MLERKLNHLDSFSGGSPPIPWNTESIKIGLEGVPPMCMALQQSG